jgi:hypothetical protein
MQACAPEFECVWRVLRILAIEDGRVSGRHRSMKNLLFISIALFVLTDSAGAADSEIFHALSKVQGATMLSHRELSEVEGSAVFYGTVPVPVYFDSMSAFMSEVLFTLLHVDGRTPFVTYTTAHPLMTPLPNGGITVRMESNTFIFVKTLICMVCTKF